MRADEFISENLRKWFKEKWVRFGPDGKIRGACARGDDSEGKPKCLPQAKAHALGKKGRKYAAAKKRREDPNPERRGPAKNVATKKKSNEGVAEGSDNLSYIGNCTDDDVIEHIFGDATGFAQAVEEHGDEFTIGDLVVKYDPETDVHSFYYKKQGVAENNDKKYSVTIDAIDHGVLGAINVSASSPDEAKQKVISGVKKSWAKRGDELMVRSVSVKPIHNVDEGIARGPKEKKLFELLEAWGYFITLRTVKIANDAIDNNASQELRTMQKHYLGPVMNGMNFVAITNSDLWQNPKAIPHLLKYIYQGIPYIEERIKKLVNPAVQHKYLSGIDKIKQLYKEVVAQYSQGVAEDQAPMITPESKCPHCGGALFEFSMINEKKDACYYKVKSRYKVWPSAYASGALVNCRKKGAKNWGAGGKKNEGIEEGNDQEFHTGGSKGLPMPGTYEQENDMFKRHGARRITAMTYESQLDEKWSEKYKKSINCSNPKGFSQRAHCQGRKKNKE